MMSVEGLVSDFARLWMRTPDAVICKLIPCLNWRIFIKKIKETNFYIFAYITCCLKWRNEVFCSCMKWKKNIKHPLHMLLEFFATCEWWNEH